MALVAVHCKRMYQKGCTELTAPHKRCRQACVHGRWASTLGTNHRESHGLQKVAVKDCRTERIAWSHFTHAQFSSDHALYTLRVTVAVRPH